MVNARRVVKEIGREFSAICGRTYGYFDTYKLDDAEVGLVVLGSTAGTASVAVDELRAQGKKVGLLKLRMFRPFPAEELAEALRHLKVAVVMDKSDSFGAQGGPVFIETRSALCDLPVRPVTKNFIYGLGGRDINAKQIRGILEEGLRIAQSGSAAKLSEYFGVRGDD
jgi:pyruvate ferredoxin oxidoreductase alpha subunit